MLVSHIKYSFLTLSISSHLIRSTCKEQVTFLKSLYLLRRSTIKSLTCTFSSAMKELCKIGLAENNVWHQHKEHRYEILNDIEYLKQFGLVDGTLMEIVRLVEVGELQTFPSFNLCQNQNPMYTMEVFGHGLQIEASRDMALIKICPTKLVELLMDVVSFLFLFYVTSFIQFLLFFL
jgi:hypothetical protein